MLYRSLKFRYFLLGVFGSILLILIGLLLGIQDLLVLNFLLSRLSFFVLVLFLLRHIVVVLKSCYLMAIANTSPTC